MLCRHSEHRAPASLRLAVADFRPRAGFPLPIRWAWIHFVAISPSLSSGAAPLTSQRAWQARLRPG